MIHFNSGLVKELYNRKINNYLRAKENFLTRYFLRFKNTDLLKRGENMKKKENWAEKFERRKDEIEEINLKKIKEEQLNKYNYMIKKLKEEYSKKKESDYKSQIVVLKDILEIYYKIANLEIEGVDIGKEIKILQENIDYLKFKQQYMEENQVDEMDVKIARANSEMQEMYEEEEIDFYTIENSTNKRILRMKEEAERGKDFQSWEEYKKEEEEKER